MDVPVDKWGIDIAIVGSQKCLGMPAGLVFVSSNDRAQQAMHKENGYYLNLLKYVKKAAENDTPFTPAIPLHLAAIEALDIIHAEGLQNRVKRVHKQAEATRRAFEAMGLDLFVPPGYRSDTVTAVRYPEGVDDSKVRKTLKNDHNVVIAGGQDDVKGKIFRFGHMGTVNDAELMGGIAATELVLAQNGAKIKRGAWVEAFQGDDAGGRTPQTPPFGRALGHRARARAGHHAHHHGLPRLREEPRRDAARGRPRLRRVSARARALPRAHGPPFRPVRSARGDDIRARARRAGGARRCARAHMVAARAGPFCGRARGTLLLVAVSYRGGIRAARDGP